MKLFSKLVQAINEFQPDEPMVAERDLETRLREHLHRHGFAVERQVTKDKDRYDLVCRTFDEIVCIELKLKTDTSDIKQFDKYLPKFKDGLIVVCWSASFALRNIFESVIEQSPIPTVMIELSKRYTLA